MNDFSGNASNTTGWVSPTLGVSGPQAPAATVGFNAPVNVGAGGCPRCGYCAHCGRSDPGPVFAPYYPVYPAYPYQPVSPFTVICGANT